MAQTIWDTKMSCYWECLREHIDNKRKTKKMPPSPPPKTQKKKPKPP